jgi:hypothetical protein
LCTLHAACSKALGTPAITFICLKHKAFSQLYFLFENPCQNGRIEAFVVFKRRNVPLSLSTGLVEGPRGGVVPHKSAGKNAKSEPERGEPGKTKKPGH